MKKRALSLLLALVLVISLLPLTAHAAELDNGLKYKVYEDHVEITDCSTDAISITIPATIEGLPVTAIKNSAFAWCSKLITLNIPESVTSIGEHAFQGCESLLSITIPEGVTVINDGTFYMCRRITSIDLPDSLTSIGNSAFLECKNLTAIDLPEGIISIGDSAFQSCSGLLSIDIPDGVTVIGNLTFYMCRSLAAIELPDSLTTIGDNVFYYCDSLTSVTIPDGTVSIGKTAFSTCKALVSVKLPDSVAAIGDRAFDSCFMLSDIELPDSLITVNDSIFTNCSALTSINIPRNVAIIYSSAFYNCKNLTSIYFEGNAPWIDDDAFSSVYTKITATAYYPANNPTWTADVMQDYGGDITWVPYNPDMPFSDVPLGAFYEAPVLWALNNGITTGATATTFNPNGSCLRAHVVTFLHRAAENPEPTSANNPFTDVKATDFFYKPVLWAVEKGITNGTSATKFGSFDNCNRAAVVTFLWRAKGQPEPTSTVNPFVDVPANAFYYKAVLWAVENGITNGVDATHFGPTTACNRAQVVTFPYRAYN